MSDIPREPPPEPPAPEIAEVGESTEAGEADRTEASGDLGAAWDADEEVADSVRSYVEDNDDETDVSEAFNEASEPPPELTPVFNEAAAKAREVGKEGTAQDGLSKDFNDAARFHEPQDDGEENPGADHGRDDWTPPRPPRPRPF